MDFKEQFEKVCLNRKINPPLIMRDRCRFCGEPLEMMQDWAMRTSTEVYAHRRCVEREKPTQRIWRDPS